MVTQSHTQLKEDQITGDFSACDSSDSNEDDSHKKPCLDTVIKIQCIGYATKV